MGRYRILRGTVVLEGNMPFGEPVSVEMVCQGLTVGQTFTGRGGEFFFQFGRGTGPPFSIPVPSLGTLAGSDVVRGTFSSSFLPLDFCELRVEPLLGFISPTLFLFDSKGRFPDGRVGRLVLLPNRAGGGRDLSPTFYKASKKARKAYFKAHSHLSRRAPDLNKVARELERAVRLDPDFAVAWNLLAQINRMRDKRAAAEKAFKQAIRVDPKYAPPYLGLARLYADKSDWVHTLEVTGELRALKVVIPEIHYLEGIAHFYQADLDKAERSFRKIDPELASGRYPLALLHLGIICCARGEVTGAMSQFRAYLESAPPEKVPQWHRDRIEQQVGEWVEEGLLAPQDAQLPG